MSIERTTEIERILQGLFPGETGELHGHFVDIKNKNGVSLGAFLANDSLFIPLNSGKEEDVGKIAKLTHANLTSLSQIEGSSTFDKASKMLDIALYSQFKCCISCDIAAYGQTTGIHIYSKPANNQEEFMPHLQEFLDEKGLGIKFIALL